MDKTGWSDVAIVIAVIVLVILCSGSPDIIDGWAKRVNAVECERGAGHE